MAGTKMLGKSEREATTLNGHCFLSFGVLRLFLCWLGSLVYSVGYSCSSAGMKEPNGCRCFERSLLGLLVVCCSMLLAAGFTYCFHNTISSERWFVKTGCS